MHNGDSPGGGGLPHHQLLANLLQRGAGRDGDLGHRYRPQAQKSMRRSIFGVSYCFSSSIHISLPIWQTQSLKLPILH